MTMYDNVMITVTWKLIVNICYICHRLALGNVFSVGLLAG